MKIKLYTPVFSLTLLLSAILLFSVQPMFSKMILPLLGGTPQVWNTAMLFFQVMLLGGYAYAHGTTRWLSIRAQAALHIVLLLAFVIVLPIAIPEGWVPPVDKDPTLWQLSLMALTVGGPFFVLAASAPMLQRWFTSTDHPDAADPYFLYGASNLGSMTALLAYPVVIEPLWNLTQQSNIWTGGYVLLTLCTLVSAVLVWTQAVKQKAAPTRKAANDEVITWPRRLQWLILALIPSSLMLGVTTFITTDIASVPLLWILPLALYVGTFIIAFSKKPIIPKDKVLLIQGYLMIALIMQMIMFTPSPVLLIGFHMTLFFFSALLCHMELTSTRPRAEHLTEFYLIMSLGGAIGGFFNAIIAPNFLVMPIEYALALGAACFMRYASSKEPFPKKLTPHVKLAAISVIFVAIAFNISRFEYLPVVALLSFAFAMLMSLLMEKRWLFAIAICISLLIFPPGHIWGKFLFNNIVHQDRNFFGVMKVIDTTFNQRILLHGTTNHGTQALIEEYKMTPLSYYSPSSPLGDAFDYMDTRSGKQEIAVLGLGIGVAACYQKDDRHFDFFEIDKDIAEVAENKEFFTFLSDCGSPYDIVLGDGRLTIKDKPDAHYDLILLDAFSSDNIPVHLLTQEAMGLYLQKLKKDGVLIFNVSNNYLDIEPVLAKVAQSYNIPAYARVSDEGTLEGTNLQYYPAHFFSLAKTDDYARFLEERSWTQANFRKGVNLWTDQYSNIVSVIGNKTGKARAQANRQAKQAAEAQKEKAE